MSQSPLKGIRVLDVGTRLAAPFCAGLLGELGAEVIKVEQPGTGDAMRSLGPFVVDPDQDPTQESSEGYSLFWAVEGRGRRSVTLDLRRAKGQEVFRKLASQCDVVCENFRPGTLERWHIGPDDLDSKLVIVRISVFGQDGPYSERGGLDRLGIAYGGLLNLTGYVDRPPVRPGLNLADYMTGVFAAHAAIAALYERDTTGSSRGLVIDAALYAAVLRVNEWTLAAYDRLGVVRQRFGNRLENSAPIDNYLAADGTYICIVAGSDNNFKRLCEAMGRADLLADPEIPHRVLPRRPRRRSQRRSRPMGKRTPRLRSGAPLPGNRSTGRPNPRRRRDLQRPSHRLSRRPHGRRRPRSGPDPPAGTIPPSRSSAATRPNGGTAARRTHPVRAGRTVRTRRRHTRPASRKSDHLTSASHPSVRGEPRAEIVESAPWRCRGPSCQ